MTIRNSAKRFRDAGISAGSTQPSTTRTVHMTMYPIASDADRLVSAAATPTPPKPDASTPSFTQSCRRSGCRFRPPHVSTASRMARTSPSFGPVTSTAN